MAFKLTGRVYFKDPDDKTNRTYAGSFSSCEWENSIDDYRNTAKIVLPRFARGNKRNDIPSFIYQILKRGFSAKIKCGYDGRNQIVFDGFISSMTEKGSTIEITCEGYSYLLRNRVIGKIYHNVKLRPLLEEIISGTGIKLHDSIPDVTLSGNVNFSKMTGIDALEYFKNKCFQNVHFFNDVLYVGLKFIPVGQVIKYKVGWNVINIDNLSILEEIISTKVVVSKRLPSGLKVESTSGEGNVLKIDIRHFTDSAFIKKVADSIHKDKTEVYVTGSFVTFLQPYAKPYDSCIIDNPRFPDYNGKYLIGSVKGSMSTTGGGRQTIGLSIKL